MERLQISRLENDLLRFGIEDAISPTDLRKINSLKGADDLMVELHHEKVKPERT